MAACRGASMASHGRKRDTAGGGEDLFFAHQPKSSEKDADSGNLRDSGSENILDSGSRVDLASSPVSRMEAKRRARWILENGKLSLSRNARHRMGDHRMDTNDVLCVLRGSHINDEGEIEKGSVRYRMETSRMAVVFVLRSAEELVVVTAWRKS